MQNADGGAGRLVADLSTIVGQIFCTMFSSLEQNTLLPPPEPPATPITKTWPRAVFVHGGTQIERQMRIAADATARTRRQAARVFRKGMGRGTFDVSPGSGATGSCSSILAEVIAGDWVLIRSPLPPRMCDSCTLGNGERNAGDANAGNTRALEVEAINASAADRMRAARAIASGQRTDPGLHHEPRVLGAGLKFRRWTRAIGFGILSSVKFRSSPAGAARAARLLGLECSR